MSGISYSMPRFQAIDMLGRPMVGATLYTYQNKTTTPAPTWRDKGQAAYNTNPVVLDARGEAVIWLDPAQVYTFVLRDWFGALVWSQDDVAGSASPGDIAGAIGGLTDRLADSASPLNGTGMIGTFQRTPLSSNIQSLSFFLQSQPYSLWEYANLADRSGGDAPEDWEWGDSLQAAFDAVPDGGALLIPPGKHHVSGTRTLRNKSINIICFGEIVLSRDAESYIYWVYDPIAEVPGTQLSALPKKGDRRLKLPVAPVEDVEKTFIALKSSEVEIVRIGDPEYTPYTKNEVNDIFRRGMQLRGTIKLDYTVAESLNVEFYKKGTPVRISGLRISISDKGAAPSRKSPVLSIKGVSNVSFDHLVIDRTNSNWPGTNIWIRDSIAMDWSLCKVLGFNSSVGDSYSWLAETSGFMTFQGCGHTDGEGDKEERGFAGRHCCHMLFDACLFPGVDDHYGHNYIVQNMTMSRGVGISGGSLTVRNIEHSSASWPLVTLRADTPYADGDLVIENCSTDFCLLWSVRADDARATRRKTWDKIRIINPDVNAETARGAVTVRHYLPIDEKTRTKSLIIDDADWFRNAAGADCALFMGSTEDEDGGARFNWVENVRVKNGYYQNNRPNSYTALIQYLTCSNFWTESNNGLSFASLSCNEGKFTDDSIGLENNSICSFVAGSREFRGCRLNVQFAGFSGPGTTWFSDCRFDANPFNDSAFVSTIIAMSANTATVPLPGVPGTEDAIWNYQRP